MSDEFSACVHKDCDCTKHDCAVPIKVNRVFDSCSDRDCLKNIPVILCSELPACTNLVKAKCVTVSDVCIDVDPVPFNKGFFSVDITYTFDVEIQAFERACECPKLIRGTAYASKNAILFGSESSIKTFFSNGRRSDTKTDCCCNTVSLPTAGVSIVEPIVLEAKIGTACNEHEKDYRCKCECVCDCDFEAERSSRSRRTVLLTLGMFSVIELIRPVTIMVPTYDYTIPQKECTMDSDSPCDVFDKIKFPAEEFSPATLEQQTDCGECGLCC